MTRPDAPSKESEPPTPVTQLGGLAGRVLTLSRSPRDVPARPDGLGTPEAPIVEGLTTDTFEWLKWEDAENLLVGPSQYVEGPRVSHIRVVAFTVPRQVNLAGLRTVDTPQEPTIAVTETIRSGSPFGLPPYGRRSYIRSPRHSRRLSSRCRKLHGTHLRRSTPAVRSRRRH